MEFSFLNIKFVHLYYRSHLKDYVPNDMVRLQSNSDWKKAITVAFNKSAGNLKLLKSPNLKYLSKIKYSKNEQ